MENLLSLITLFFLMRSELDFLMLFTIFDYLLFGKVSVLLN